MSEQNLLDLMAGDAESGVGVPLPKDADFATISELVNEQLRLQGMVEEAEKALADAKDALRSIERDKLPKAITKFNFTQFKVKDAEGRDIVISIKDEVRAGITAEKHDAAMTWLEKTGHDDIIKNSVTCSFGKGQDGEVKSLIGVLNASGYSFENKRNVHPSTLKAFVKQQMENGTPVPVDVFSVYVEQVAKITMPRSR